MRRCLVSVGAFLLATVLCGWTWSAEPLSEGPGIRRFDFGPADSPVVPGFALATERSAYDPAKGFGWITDLTPVGETGWGNIKQPIISSRLRDLPDDASRDHVYGFSGYDVVKPIEATFQVDLPNGDYIVHLSVGDSGTTRTMCPFHIDINGTRMVTDIAPSYVTVKQLTGKVTDGKLRIKLTADPEESEKRCKADRWTERIFTLWTLEYVMIYPAGDEALLAKDLVTLEDNTLETFRKRYIPEGRMQRFEVRDGCVVRDGKPMFFNHRHEWGIRKPEFLDFLSYFAFGNAVMSQRGTDLARGNVKFLSPDWQKSGDFPVELYSQATDAYKAGMLCTAYGGVYMEVPPELKDAPYARCVDNLGATRDYPNYNDPLYREYVRQVFVNLGKWTRQHPGIIASYPYEEMYYRVWDGTILSYDPLSIRKYRQFLADKYGTIENLNRAWNANYPDFGAIDPPRKKEQTPNFANFQLHRARSLVEGYPKPSYEAFKQADPYHLVIGEKPNGQYFYANYSLCSDGFNYTPFCDIAKGEGGLSRNRAEIDYWGLARASMAMSLPKCAFQDLPEGALDPWTKTVPGADDYVDLLGMFFQGMKVLYTESYDAGGGAYHLVHPTKQYRDQPPQTPVSRETLKFKDIPLADFVLEPQALTLSRVYQFAYRTAPVLMPAKVRPSDVGHICTEMTTLFGYAMRSGSEYGIQGDYAAVERLLQHLDRPVDVLTEYDLTRKLPQYRVVLAGLHGSVAGKEMVADLRRFVAEGGSVILSGEGFRYDYDTLHSGAESPVAAFGDLLAADMGQAADFVSSSPLVVKDARFTPGLKPGDVLLVGRNLDYTTMPVRPDCVVLASVDDKPVAIASPDGRVVYIGIRYLGNYYRSMVPKEDNLRQFIGAFIDRSGSKAPVRVTGGPDSFRVRAGVMDSFAGHLVEIGNTSVLDQKVNVKLPFLPDGDYDVVDITGELPIVEKNARNEFHLKNDLAGRHPRLMLQAVSADLLARAGMDLDLRSRQSRVLLVRPAYEQVYQLLPDYTVRAVCRLPVTIVLPDAPTAFEKTTAEEIGKLLTAWGTDVKTAAASEVAAEPQTKAVTFEQYLMESFRGDRIVTDRNLIVIGEASRNALTARLYADGTFACDKVMLRSAPAVPGPGRGVIQLVESVNRLVYDVTDKSTDAIVVTGSDEAGLKKAVERFQMILWQ